jgi:hypothetical protein
VQYLGNGGGDGFRSPWFRLWQRYGAINDLATIKARTEALVTRIENVPVSERAFENRGTLSAHHVPHLREGKIHL